MIQNKMNSKNLKYLVFVCGLAVGVLSVSPPWESAKGNNAEDSSTSTPVTKQPASGKKTYSPKPPAVRIV